MLNTALRTDSDSVEDDRSFQIGAGDCGPLDFRMPAVVGHKEGTVTRFFSTTEPRLRIFHYT